MVVLQWIPAHTGKAGNEIADQLAKEGRKKYQPSSVIQRNKNNRQTSTFIASIGGYNPQKDPLQRLSCLEQTTIFRLRTGHCGLKGHLTKIGIQPSALCDCGKDNQTSNHFLQSCPLYNRERQHIWPVSTTMDAKFGALQTIYIWQPILRPYRDKGFHTTNRRKKKKEKDGGLAELLLIPECCLIARPTEIIWINYYLIPI